MTRLHNSINIKVYITHVKGSAAREPSLSLPVAHLDGGVGEGKGHHVLDEGQVDVAGAERAHDLTIVRLDLAREGGDGARHLGLRDEREEAKHGKAAVVDLDVELARLLLVRQLLGEAEGVEEVERHRVRDLLEGGEVARLAAAHVVGLAVLLEHVARLGPELEEADDDEDLQARILRRRVPHGRRREALEGRVVRQRVGELPRPVDAVLVDAVANEAGHGNAAVLDLGVTEPSDGRLVALVPELARAKVCGSKQARENSTIGRQRLCSILAGARRSIRALTSTHI